MVEASWKHLQFVCVEDVLASATGRSQIVQIKLLEHSSRHRALFSAAGVLMLLVGPSRTAGRKAGLEAASAAQKIIIITYCHAPIEVRACQML